VINKLNERIDRRLGIGYYCEVAKRIRSYDYGIRKQKNRETKTLKNRAGFILKKKNMKKVIMVNE